MVLMMSQIVTVVVAIAMPWLLITMPVLVVVSVMRSFMMTPVVVCLIIVSCIVAIIRVILIITLIVINALVWPIVRAWTLVGY